MRPIKFRAWDKEDEVMCEVDVIGFSEGAVTISNENVKYYHLGINEVELMQSTGLKDKNGVVRYEHSELDGAYEVIFKDLRYSLRHINDDDIIDLYDYWRVKNGKIEVTREYTKV